MTQKPSKNNEPKPTPSKHAWLEEMREADRLTPEEIEQLKADAEEDARIGGELFREKMARQKELMEFLTNRFTALNAPTLLGILPKPRLDQMEWATTLTDSQIVIFERLFQENPPRDTREHIQASWEANRKRCQRMKEF